VGAVLTREGSRLSDETIGVSRDTQSRCDGSKSHDPSGSLAGGHTPRVPVSASDLAFVLMQARQAAASVRKERLPGLPRNFLDSGISGAAGRLYSVPQKAQRRREIEMRRRIAIILSCTVGILVCAVIADDLGFEGHDLVEPDCDAMSSWFECRDIDTAPPGVVLGYLYMHHTSETLGPDGNTKYPDGEPYVTTITACSSCHFTGGHVPFGSPVYQSPSKYHPDPETGLGPYFRPLGYHRDLEDSIIDCFRNCMNAERAPEKDDPVMVALVSYIHWVADGIIDPAMQDDWTLLPPEAGPRLPSIAGVSSMRADPIRGASLYANRCSDCHDKDAPGAGEYRIGEERPRIPALWGIEDGYSRGAAFYRTPVLAAYVQKHMPYDEPETLGDQDALDIAAYINAPDKMRPSGMADVLYCHDDPDGIPSALRKPADWLVGCEYPGEREHFASQGIDYDDMVLNGPWDELAAWRTAEVEQLLACPEDLDESGIVNVADLLALLANWGGTGVGDIDANGTVDVQDLLLLLGAWGEC
jgi:cytochrome c